MELVNGVVSMLKEIEELKSLDISEKCYDPTKKFSIHYDNCSFTFTPNFDNDVLNGVDCNFRCNYYEKDMFLAFHQLDDVIDTELGILSNLEADSLILKSLLSSHISEDVDYSKLYYDLENPSFNLLWDEEHQDYINYFESLSEDEILDMNLRSDWTKKFQADGVEDMSPILRYIFINSIYNKRIRVLYKSIPQYTQIDGIYYHFVLSKHGIILEDEELFIEIYNILHRMYNAELDLSVIYDKIRYNTTYLHYLDYLSSSEESLPIHLYEEKYYKRLALDKGHIRKATPEELIRYCTYYFELLQVLDKYNVALDDDTKDLLKGIKKFTPEGKEITAMDKLIELTLEKLSDKIIAENFDRDFYLLTDCGKEFYEKNSYYVSDYLDYLPFPFTKKEFIELVESNRDYCVDDLIYMISHQEWISVEDKKSFSKREVDEMLNINNMNRSFVADNLEKHDINNALKLYNQIISSDALSFREIRQVCNLYEKSSKTAEERELLEYSIHELNNYIDFNSITYKDNVRIDYYIRSIAKLIKNSNLSEESRKYIHMIYDLLKKFRFLDMLNTYEFVSMIKYFENLIEYIDKSEESMNWNNKKEMIDMFNQLRDLVYYYGYKMSTDSYLQCYEWIKEKLSVISTNK